VREEEMRCQYFKDEKKKRKKKCKLSLSLARENTFNIRTASLKATFNGRRTEPLSLSLSLSLSLFISGQNQREKDIEEAYLFPLSLNRKDKKKQSTPPKKEKKNSPSSSNTVCFSLLVLVGDQKMFLFRR